MSRRHPITRFGAFVFSAVSAVFALGGATCLSLMLPDTGGVTDDTEPMPIYNNTTDPTNDNASYIGAGSCIACHAEQGARHAVSAHAQALKRVEGAAPSYPTEATRAGAPNPPTGFAWTDLAYVIGGYMHKMLFINLQGYVLTNDADGVDTQWNLALPSIGTLGQFVAYENEGRFSAANPKPYDYSCFRCHTTGAREQDPANPEFEEDRPGFAGTFEEAGVRCEECHGPGSKHPPERFARNLYVSSIVCRRCHVRGDDVNVIQAEGGFVKHNQQAAELKGSGVHSSFSCTTCHDPHTSVTYAKDDAIIQGCTDCHTGQNMALHEGKVFARGGETEIMTCESCHMPYATKTAATATAAVVGAIARVADTRTHIVRINAAGVDYTSMFTTDGSRVRRDGSKRAAVTLDFVCVRCHNEVDFPFALTVASASGVAQGIHSK